MSRYGICEWYGTPLQVLTPTQRQERARVALGDAPPLPCPFQANHPPCSKAGGVCSIQSYTEGVLGRVGPADSPPTTVCPARFAQDQMVIRWLAEIVGFPRDETLVAREIPFMHSLLTNKPAGKIDLVIGRHPQDGELRWYGLEIQAVYFSGKGMPSQFRILREDDSPLPPYPDKNRRPDWRSSSAKRLMPQLEIKVPTMRRWQAGKMAVAVDQQFFEAVGGPNDNYTRDLNEGDVIWLIPELVPDDATHHYQLQRGHWEVLTLEASTTKLLAAATISRGGFEEALINKLVPLEPID